MQSSNKFLASDSVALLKKCEILKSVERHTQVLGGARSENSAEHSWHASIASLLLRDLEPENLDRNRSTLMLLVHELVEIEAGDFHIFEEGYEDKLEQELKAAESLFPETGSESILEIRELWHEFEFGDSVEAKWARAVDMFMPLFVNYVDGGKAWGDFRIDKAAYKKKKESIKEGSEKLWDVFCFLVDDAVSKGWIDADGS